MLHYVSTITTWSLCSYQNPDIDKTKHTLRPGGPGNPGTPSIPSTPLVPFTPGTPWGGGGGKG